MKIEAWGQTDVGLKRENNQDTILVDKDLGLYIVADGMGGHKGGEVASSMAVDVVREVVASYIQTGRKIPPPELLKVAYSEASARIYKASTVDNPELAGMGTTMVCALLKDDQIFIGNVGDSRAYLMRDDLMWQVTEDHSLVNEQIRAGVIKPGEEKDVVGKNVITRSVGFEHIVNVDVISRKVIPNEKILLCSDGLSGMINDREIFRICQRNSSKEAVTVCINEAKRAGGDDNISVVIFDVLG